MDKADDHDGHNHEKKPPPAATAHASFKEVARGLVLPKGKSKGKVSKDALEEKPVTLIHCAAVSLQTTTDLVNGRVIVLAKDTSGKLCLLRPVLDDCCGKCHEARFTCIDLPFGKVAGYDICMKADGTLVIAFIEDGTGILQVQRETRYGSNEFQGVYRKGLSWRLSQLKAIKDANGNVHVFSSNLDPITITPDPKNPPTPRPTTPCDPAGTLFHSYEQPNEQWDQRALTAQCIRSYTLELDNRNDANTIYVAGIDGDDGMIHFTTVAGSSTQGYPQPSVWKKVHEPKTFFLRLCSVSGKDGTPELFAIDHTGTIVRSKKADGDGWSDWAPLVQQSIMQRKHRGIMAELDYTGCIKVFVHADDNFAYVAEQASPNADQFIGWMNV